ncbi:hypothetical protein [Planococcus plakortidis]|uniref:hypothetical protein n=1 Tax=Planococcus plakortidis TaxID=1038856 RepID=UPI0038591405
MLLLYRILLTISSTSLFVVIYLIKSNVTYDFGEGINSELISYIGYFGAVIILNLLSLSMIRFLESSSLQSQTKEKDVLIEIEMANHTFLPTYLGYFFVALSIESSDWIVFGFIYSIVFIFTFFSQTNYFNPLFILMGYQFYYVTTVNNIKVFLITKKLMKNPAVHKFNNLKRINDFTFIDRER